MIELGFAALLLPLSALGLLLLNEARLRSGLFRPALVAVLRAGVQLALLGLVLAWLFERAGVFWLGLCMVVMLVAAVREPG